jgi:hypothetical protein
MKLIKPMYLKRLVGTIGICCCAAGLIAQTADTTHPKKHKFALYGGVGPNYYFNNLVIGKNYVNDFNYSFTGKLMWEPGHLLSLGIESGYYRLYTLNATGQSTAHIANSAVPLQLIISMKFLQSFHVDFSMGQSRLTNKVTSDAYGSFTTKAWSFADFSGTVGYRYPINPRFSIGAEAKYFYSTAFVDRNIALIFMAGYHF